MLPGEAPLRVLHLTSERGWRGGEQQLLYLASALRERGVEQVLAVRRGTAAHERFRREGFHVTPLAIANEHPAVLAPVSISVGVAAVIPSGDHGPQILVSEADRQLYDAKRSGRNRTCAAAAATRRA